MRHAALFTIIAALALPAAGAVKRVFVVFEAGQGAMLRWPLPSGPLPAIFRVERNRTAIATLQPGGNLATVSAEDRELISRYQRSSRGTDKKSVQLAGAFMTLRSIIEPAVAAALGISAVDGEARAGATVTYDVYAGDVLYATSGATPLVETSLPAPPATVIANATRETMTLTWEGEDSNAANAAVLYLVYRSDGSAEPTLVSTAPILASASSDGDSRRATFVDRFPAVEKSVRYTVVSRDAFGRSSPASAPIEVLYADFAALDPPKELKAAVASDGVKVTWTAPRNVNRVGWRVVRSLNDGALGETLTATTLAANELVDTTAVAGVTYYYRVSAVNARGDEGSASPSVAIQARLGRPPVAPASIDVALSAGRVFLEWPAVPKALGYRVEREMNTAKWASVSDVVRVPRFEDVLPLGLGGVLSYRVVTIGADGTPSEPSRVAVAQLPDTKAPLAPVIVGIDDSGGKARLDFRADGRPGETSGFLVLRSGNRYDNGVIVHAAPLPAGATSFVDDTVTAGTTYYYRMLAVDATGNRSLPSEPAVGMTVGAPPIAAPAAPRARYEVEPFPRVELTFAELAPQSVRYVVQRQENGEWLLIAGPLPANALTAMDTRPPSGAVVYRLLAVPADGGDGVPSAVVTVKVE
jgi:fibronectin type 3 domain-containing protein